MRNNILLMVACTAALGSPLQHAAVAQQRTREYSIGLKCGYASDPWSMQIGDHVVYGVFVERRLTMKISLTIDATYFQNATDSVWATLEHRGSVYTAMTPYIWQNIAVGVGAKYSLLSQLRAGGGVAVNTIITRRATYAKSDPFMIDYPEENVSFEGEKNCTNIFVRPSAFLTTDFSFALAQSVLAILEGKFTADFLGCAVPENRYVISGIFEMSVSLRYDFK